MELMGVAELAKRGFGTMSSGERRRVLIARALVHEPEILVLDEPSTALDFAASVRLSTTLEKLLNRGTTLVLVTHHPGEILPGIASVVLLKEGRIFAQGAKRDLLTSAGLTRLYGVDLRVKWSDGWCDVRPA